MRTLKISETNKVVIYSSAKEMTLNRYSKFQKYLLLETGVGSSMQSIEEHFAKLDGFLTHSMIEDAKTERQNLHYNFWAVLQEIDFESNAFACLVYSINDELVTDISEENLKFILEMLSFVGLTKEIAEQQVDDIKKKISLEIASFFPQMGADEDNSMHFFENLKRKIMLTEQIISDSPNIRQLEAAVFAIDKIFAELTKPKIFDEESEENAIVKLESSYEYLCSLLEMNGVKEPKTLTMIEFYSRLDYFKKSNQRNPIA